MSTCSAAVLRLIGNGLLCLALNWNRDNTEKEQQLELIYNTRYTVQIK